MKINTPQRVRDAIRQLDCTERVLAEALRLGTDGRRQIARWKKGKEDGGFRIPGAAQMWLEYWLWGELPKKPEKRHRRDDD